MGLKALRAVLPPDTEVYAAVCREAGFEPHEMLHVGDDPDNDIVAAGEAGWRTVWLNRSGDVWQHQESDPDDIVTDLYQLTKLFDRG